ncbi:hypothetical protein CRC_02656 [Cylindrospermopsis raciborskii CS-505]|nr:hypothetical protein CRC_02656 [Cylindrospermopsis raciborskii CS-505]
MPASLWEVELMETTVNHDRFIIVLWRDKPASLWEVELMETIIIKSLKTFFLARFPLGSGINGNRFLPLMLIPARSARFPLGSGINGNLR